MTSETGSTVPQEPAAATTPAVEEKGKGKSGDPTVAEDDTAMDEDADDDDDDEEDDDNDEEEVEQETGDADEDGLDAIDASNIVQSRTRGRQIDFAKAAEENPADDEDDEDDEDYAGEEEPSKSGSDDKMDED